MRLAPKLDPSFAWRFAVLGGATAGLALAPLLSAGQRGGAVISTAVAALVAISLAAMRPPGGGAGGAWLALVLAAALLAGLGVGAVRLAAIDRGAFDGPVGRSVTVGGFVAATPSRSHGIVRVQIESPAGKLLAEAHEPVPDLPIGRKVSASGTLRRAPPWEAGYLARYGIDEVLDAHRISLTGRRRGGIEGVVDGIRDRAGAAIGRGTSPAGAALLRGFVLGEADRIDAATVTDFRRSGLAHLLAVSGENVLLLALLATPVLALLGVPLRARLTCLLGLIALYVAVTGAGPSIQRAGVMGAAGVVAALAGRPRSRWYAALLAATVTLAINPRATGDPGWQLSFAAVIGIMLLAAPVRDALLALLGPVDVGRWRRAVAEGAAVTIAATLATAPLIAADFGVASLTTLPANLLALPAVAPVMWVGMIVAALGQIPGLPVEPLTALGGALAGYVAQIAHWLGSPSWAQVSVPSLGAPVVVASYLALAAAAAAGLAFVLRRRGVRPRRRAVALAAAAIAIAAGLLIEPATPAAPAAPGLRVSVLDVGQGDAILLDPSGGLPILVDGGPSGDGIGSELADAGVDRLAAAVITHDQSDHAGGIEDLLGTLPIDHLLYGEPVPRITSEARAAGADPVEVAEGSEVDSGRLRLELLWPPRELESPEQARDEDPNVRALVALARWGRFSMLLTADAEAADVPIDPGPIDVLKVAHHGSDDPGLDRLLDEAAPRLAVISVGADNPYGHPTPGTLATLVAHRVPVMRTDLDGTVEIDVDRHGWSVHPQGG
jgi:competence protein ComEC